MRVLQLADAQADIFEGAPDDHAIAEAIVGVPGEAVSLSEAMEAERAANAHQGRGASHG